MQPHLPAILFALALAGKYYLRTEFKCCSRQLLQACLQVAQHLYSGQPRVVLKAALLIYSCDLQHWPCSALQTYITDVVMPQDLDWARPRKALSSRLWHRVTKLAFAGYLCCSHADNHILTRMM